MLELQKLIYGDRSLFLSSLSTSTKNIVNPIEVSKFLIVLNEMGYQITNINKIFKLSSNDFDLFKEELFNLFDSLKIEGFIFRKRFAKSIKMKDYSNKEWIAMFAQYSITYGWSDVYFDIFNKNPKDILEKDFTPEESVSQLKTNLKKFEISFDIKNDLKNILIDMLSSKIVLREQQIRIIEESPIEILENAYKNSEIVIKETEIYVFKRILTQDNINIDYFKDIDQIVRIIVNLYSHDKEGYILRNNRMLLENVGQINNSLLKTLIIKIPTKVKKVITKALNSQKNTDYVVEKMFKYYGFWKKIFTALKWESENKTSIKYPVFKKIKDKLYLNDRSNTFNGRIEAAKNLGDYDKAIRIMSENPGYLMRNLLEYLRYTKGETIAKKVKFEKYEDPNRFNNYTDDELFTERINIASLLKGKKNEENNNSTVNREIIVQTDARNFLKSEEFINVLLKTNTKLLWQTYSLLEDEKLFLNKKERKVQETHIFYERELPGIKRDMVKIVKSSILKAIKKIKKEENKSLGNVFIDENIKNFNIQFSGRKSSGITLSGEYLTPGSKIPFSELIGQNKIIRLGIAWRGKESCDIDHSLNFLDEESTVYYGTPTYSKNKKVIITSSGDITNNDDELFSTELIDIDLDLAIKENLGDMITSAIVYSGLKLNNYEVFWFMNIIDKNDRILENRVVEISLDQMDYAIQINEDVKSMIGFYINMKESHLEVLNIGVKTHNYGNAVSSRKQFKEALLDREKLIPMDEALISVIRKKQIVKNIEDADYIICSQYPEDMDENKVYITPGKNGEKINQLIF